MKVLIADDSAFMRMAIKRMVSDQPDIKVVGEARTGLACVQMAEDLRPDVITMDVEMPEMDGLEAVRQIMTRCPAPIIMLSSLTEANSVTTIKALELGAVDFIAKKSSFVQLDIAKVGGELLEKLRFWSRRRGVMAAAGARAFSPGIDVSAPVHLRQVSSGSAPPGLVVVGISTGGPATLPGLLKAMNGPLSCPMIVAQHMPPLFTAGFASHLRTETGLNVVESQHGLEARPGMIVIAKGGTDVVVREPFPGKITLYERIEEEASIHPNADVLFRSASSVSCPVVAVVMTGMGEDGTAGGRDLAARKGCQILVQEPTSCVVDGMPGSIIGAGLATAVLRPADIGVRLARLAGSHSSLSSNSSLSTLAGAN